MLSTASSLDQTNTISEFRKIAEEVAAYFQQAGVNVKAYHEASLPHFSALSQERKRSAVHYLSLIRNIILDQTRNGTDAGNDSMALWSALKIFELTPGKELFRFLEGDDKIEVYDLAGIQIWRNCNVMEICSYTLEEIYSFEWQERYERAEAQNHAILNAVKETLEKGIEQYVHAGISDHLVIEKFSELRFQLNVRHDYFFPLFGKDGKVQAFLVTSKVKILDRAKTDTQPLSKKVRSHSLVLVPDQVDS